MPALAKKAPDQKRVGPREQSRRSSLSKLIATARHLFVEVGYEAATLRKIAEASGLGMGTVFHYISEKRDLIYLIFNEQAEERSEKAYAELQPWQTFREKILSVSEPHYQLLALEPELGRILLSEINHQLPGKHYLRHVEIRDRVLAQTVGLVEEAQRSGEIGSSASAELIARTIFFAYSSSARWWINSPNPTWRKGLKDFGDVLDIVLHGLMVKDKSRPADP